MRDVGLFSKLPFLLLPRLLLSGECSLVALPPGRPDLILWKVETKTNKLIAFLYYRVMSFVSSIVGWKIFSQLTLGIDQEEITRLSKRSGSKWAVGWRCGGGKVGLESQRCVPLRASIE